MGIYIKGMEMPTKENAVILISPSGDVWMIGNMPNEDTHLVKAKAAPVPPHGQLIDADASEHDGWTASRIYQVSPTESVYETKHMNEFPAIIEADGEK